MTFPSQQERAEFLRKRIQPELVHTLWQRLEAILDEVAA